MVAAGHQQQQQQQVISAKDRKMIQSIKEIAGNHSDSDIFAALKETDMDPDETAQKLLNQDTFHEVRRKRDKRKEVPVIKNPVALQPNRRTVLPNQRMKLTSESECSFRGARYTRNAGYARTPGYTRNPVTDVRVSRQFRVVRDNRINQNAKSKIEPSPEQSPESANKPVVSKVSENSSTGASSSQKPPVGRQSFQSSSGISKLHPRQAKDAHLSDRKDSLEDEGVLVPNAGSQMKSTRPNDSQPNSTTSSNNSDAGVYSSSSDLVHVPSPDSRPAGAIKREVGVGVRRKSTEKPVHLSHAQSSSLPNSHLGHDGPSRETVQSSISKSGQLSRTSFPESTKPNNAVSKPLITTQYSSRHYQPMAHQKASQSNREWKPKASKKQTSTGPGIIGTPAKSASPPDVPKDLETEAVQLEDKLPRLNISENQNVFIAEHIRVSEIDRNRLTFGSLGTGLNCSLDPRSQVIEDDEESYIEPPSSLSNSPGESSSDETSVSKQIDLLDERFQNSGTDSPATDVVSEQELVDKKEPSSRDLENYANIGLVQPNNRSYTPLESQQPQDPQLPNFSAYDSQTMYNPYYRPTVDETAMVQGLQYPHEALSSLAANSVPVSPIGTVQQQQQQPPIGQVYPQVHVSPYANLMPYRQFISPLYVPPMAVPGYSNNPSYAHPSNGNNYLVMPGAASSLKYGIQPFKPVPTASPTGFGNFTGPSGYAINAPGIGSVTGLEDSSRLNYKDGNIYATNPQAETSEMWMNPRDVPGLQSASYYNMTGQKAHAAYLPSHSSHASFNAVAQSSHMQFPGMYHPPQPTGISSPHHLGPGMGNNIGVGVGAGAPGPQVGAYQQPQLGHMNWTGNF